MGTIVLDYAKPRDDQKQRVIGWLEGTVLAAGGILLPMVCFAASLKLYPGGPVYQRGEWLDYLTLVPSVWASWPFAPLLFAASFAMAVLVIAPRRVAQSWLLRWALYSGAILAAQYTLIQAIAITEPSAPLSVGTIVAIVAAGIATLLSLLGLWAVPGCRASSRPIGCRARSCFLLWWSWGGGLRCRSSSSVRCWLLSSRQR